MGVEKSIKGISLSGFEDKNLNVLSKMINQAMEL